MVAIQGEVSLGARVSTTRESSYRIGTFADTTNHSDAILSGLVRIGPGGGRCCDLLAGAGVVFARTSATSVLTDRDTGIVTTTHSDAPNTTRLALTIGGDAPIRLAPHISLLPTARLHWMSRGEQQSPVFDTRPIGRLGSVAFRAGVGARVDF
jgi:hypothetical protein